MNTSTQAMNAINKVQTPTQGNKANTDKKSPDLQFEALFSSAMGQIAPNAQLNSIESQLRESLFKQDKPRKDTESNINAEAAQAAVWAQRNWMQQASAPAPQSGLQSVNNTGSNAPQNRVAETTAPREANNSQSASTPAEDTAAPARQAESQAQSKSPETPSRPTGETAGNTENTPEQTTQATATAPQANSAPVLPGNTHLTALDGMDGASLQPGTASTTAAASPTPTQGSAQPTGVQMATAAEAASQARDTGNAQVDALLSSGSISKAGDTAATATSATAAASANGIPAGSNASAVAAQLAPQIAQQIQGKEAGLEIGELKAGQKILAGSNLTAAGNPNAVAAGTNGLTGPSGAAQQALIKTPVNQPGFAKEVAQTVQWAIGKNMSTVDIRVNPESFGPMNMRLVQKGQQVQLVIRTQDEASANLLSQSLSSLKEVLAQNGLQLNQVQIQHGNTPTGTGQGQQNPSQAQFEQQSGQQGRGGQQSTQGGMATDDQGPTVTPASGSKPAGQLDMFA